MSYILNILLFYDNIASLLHESQGSSQGLFVFSLADDDNLNVSADTAGGPKKDRFCRGPFRAPHSFLFIPFLTWVIRGQ